MLMFAEAGTVCVRMRCTRKVDIWEIPKCITNSKTKFIICPLKAKPLLLLCRHYVWIRWNCYLSLKTQQIWCHTLGTVCYRAERRNWTHHLLHYEIVQSFFLISSGIPAKQKNLEFYRCWVVLYNSSFFITRVCRNRKSDSVKIFSSYIIVTIVKVHTKYLTWNRNVIFRLPYICIYVCVCVCVCVYVCVCVWNHRRGLISGACAVHRLLRLGP